MQSKRAGIGRLCECAICHERLQNAHICPECSNPFCRKCITEWLSRHRDCPICREQLTVKRLVKARFFDQVQEVIKNGSAMECSAHMKQVSLFCWPCLECICVTCMFAETHAGHKGEIVLCESAAQDLKSRVTDELKWIVNREREIARAIEQHGGNVKTLTNERDRILANVQEVLTEVKRQFDEALAKQQEMVTLLEADSNGNAELRRVSEEWIKSEKILEHLPNIADLLKRDHFNSSLTKPKPVDPVYPEFKNDLIPELTVFKLDIKGKESSRTFQVDPGFEFKDLVNPCEQSIYSVTLRMTKGTAGEYLVALEKGTLVPIKLELRKATYLGWVKPVVSTSMTIKIELAKTYAGKCRQYQASIVKGLEEATIRKHFFVQDVDRLIRHNTVWKLVLAVGIVLAVAFIVMNVLKPHSNHTPPGKYVGWWNKLFDFVLK